MFVLKKYRKGVFFVTKSNDNNWIYHIWGTNSLGMLFSID